MTDLINLTGLQNSTTVFDMVNFANTASENGIGAAILIGIFFIILIILISRKQAEFTDAAMAAAWVSMFVSIFLRALEMISTYMVLVCIMVLAIVTAIRYLQSKS